MQTLLKLGPLKQFSATETKWILKAFNGMLRREFFFMSSIWCLWFHDVPVYITDFVYQHRYSPLRLWHRRVLFHLWPQSLSNVFQNLRNASLKLNPTKCKFAKSSVIYLSDLISEDALQPDPGKVSHLLQLSSPSSRKELDRFCGFTNFLSKFAPHLMRLIFNAQHKRRFEWTSNCEISEASFWK